MVKEVARCGKRGGKVVECFTTIPGLQNLLNLALLYLSCQ